ncbi:Arc family DNA-binding protein [Bradyrhizobium sp. th.b2]|uniref:Arc family DNA-binding protein n=1 Tax=Bradyrhizobium sp. th-b2 TaxID=172088 RepID=UPI0009FC55D0|nr:Arc family DNA-binding protein [Bradyrhizobium sp. th.b2]
MAKKRAGSKNAASRRLKQNLAEIERTIASARVVDPPAKPPSKTAPQFVLRYTPELRDQIARLATARGLSINSMLIELLEKGLSHGDAVEQLQTSTGELFDRMEALESLVREHEARLSGRDPYNVEK